MALPEKQNETNQNFNIDIEKLYTDIIKEIDSSRSVININNVNNQNVFKNLTRKSLPGIRQKLKTEPLPQESRCHAFYRLIGFPVVGTSGYYNPGFNNVRYWSQDGVIKFTTLTIDRKIEISKSPLPKFNKLSEFRENYFNTNIRRIFQSNYSIDAATLALSSSVETRLFAAASEKYTSDSDFDEKNQSYDVNFDQGLVFLTPVNLLNYIDGNGKKPTKLFKTRYHIIMPFIVDARIDFSICPNKNLYTVPFVINKNDLRIGENDYLKTPLLDKIIKQRFAKSNAVEKDGEYVKRLKEIIAGVPEIENSELIQYVINSTAGEDQSKFNWYFNIILEMVSKLYEAQQKIIETQNTYYWLPIPSTTGPEDGVTVRPIMEQFGKEIWDAKLFTPDDKYLIESIIKDAMQKSESILNDTAATPDTGGFLLTSQNSTSNFTPESTEAYGDVNSDVMTDINNKRTQTMTEAGKSLRTIEIIMGEFSGLGLCDIIAILGALYIMPRESLLGFLDDDAFERAKTVLNISGDKPELSEALSTCTSRVKDFYNLMDALYQNKSINNNRS